MTVHRLYVAYFVSDEYSWFVRGFVWSNMSVSGPFAFSYWGGGINSTIGSRVVVSVLLTKEDKNKVNERRHTIKKGNIELAR